MAFTVCPVCGKKAKCMDSRPRGEVITRRYWCTGKNQHRFTTAEFIVAYDDSREHNKAGAWLEAKTAAARLQGAQEARRRIAEALGLPINGGGT